MSVFIFHVGTKSFSFKKSVERKCLCEENYSMINVIKKNEVNGSCRNYDDAGELHEVSLYSAQRVTQITKRKNFPLETQSISIRINFHMTFMAFGRKWTFQNCPLCPTSSFIQEKSKCLDTRRMGERRAERKYRMTSKWLFTVFLTLRTQNFPKLPHRVCSFMRHSIDSLPSRPLEPSLASSVHVITRLSMLCPPFSSRQALECLISFWPMPCSCLMERCIHRRILWVNLSRAIRASLVCSSSCSWVFFCFIHLVRKETRRQEGGDEQSAPRSHFNPN